MASHIELGKKGEIILNNSYKKMDSKSSIAIGTPSLKLI